MAELIDFMLFLVNAQSVLGNHFLQNRLVRSVFLTMSFAPQLRVRVLPIGALMGNYSRRFPASL